MSTATDAAPATCKVVLSKHVVASLLSEVQEGVKTLEKAPHLVGFLANNDPAALMYAQWTEKTCEEK
jgi:methylenetetrahydrofolate dehydrogenase (NAD+)